MEGLGAAEAGAVIGSLILPPAGIIVGAAVGIFVSLFTAPLADAAKDSIKKAYR